MEALFFLALGVVLTLSIVWMRNRYAAFPAQRPSDYANQSPQFDIRQHLNGPIQCEGVIYGPTGRVSSRFVADMNATWDDNTGSMTEHFRYDSGSTQDRIWTLAIGNDGQIKATAPDIIGEGTGMQEGSAVYLKYRIKLPDDAGGHVLDVTDWMYLMENGTVMNRSQFRKFGVKVAELVATMRKVE
jgi:hypothetical protein